MGCCCSRQKEDKLLHREAKNPLMIPHHDHLSEFQSMASSDYQGVVKQVGENDEITSASGEQIRYVLYLSEKLVKNKQYNIPIMLQEESTNIMSSKNSSKHNFDSLLSLPMNKKSEEIDDPIQYLQDYIEQNFDHKQEYLQEMLIFFSNNTEDCKEMIQHNIHFKHHEQLFQEQKEDLFTQEKLETLEQFKITVQEIQKSQQYQFMYFDSFYLIRFLVSRQWELTETEDLFSNFIQWRINQYTDQVYKVIFTEEEKLNQVFKHSFHFSDDEGRPIYIESLKDLKYNNIIKSSEDSEEGVITPERFGQYYQRQYEFLINRIFPKCTENKGKVVNQIIRIIDMQDHQLKVPEITGFLKIPQQVVQDNYPETLHSMYLINTSKLFSLSFKIIKNFFPKQTQQKIKTFSVKETKKLFENIPKERIPKFMGGECECEGGCLNQNIGYWNQ